MRGAVMYGPGDVRIVEREAPRIIEPTDAIIRVFISRRDHGSRRARTMRQARRLR